MGKELFGTDGIRGVAGEFPLDPRTLYWIGHTVGEYLARNGSVPRVLLGMDTRESGQAIARTLAAGLARAGAVASFAGVITTPGVACLVRQKGYAAGVVISASHNPFHDNGVKLFAASGMKFPDAVEERLEEQLTARMQKEAGPPDDSLRADATLDEEYLAFLRSRMVAGTSLVGMKIVLDCANGAASFLGPTLFRSLGAEVVAIHNQPDGRNINAGCGSLHPECLQKKVVEERAVLGVAFDGDADRALFVSASGALVNGDGVLLAAARYLKSVGQLKGRAVVGTTMTNLGLERALAKERLELVRVNVGDRYVLEGMQKLGCNLGGEQSGHIIFLDDATTGDGLLTALKMAGLVALKGPLDGLVKGLVDYPQTIVNVKVRTKPKLESLPEVSRVLAEANRALGERGRVVLRYSGTEPLARVMVEAERAEDVSHWSEAIASAIRDSLGA